MTPFASYFKLKDRERTSFRLSTERDEDLKLYVDLDHVFERLHTRLQEQAPLFAIQGDIGSGKSHLLRYVERILAPPRFEPVYIVLSGFNRRSDFVKLHQQFMPHLVRLARDAMRAPGGDKVQRVANLAGISDNMRRALQALAYPEIGVPNKDVISAEQWLCAGTRLNARLTGAGYSLELFQEAGPTQIVALYKAISDLFHQVFGKRILVLLDESESFSRVVDIDAQAHIGAGLRGFFDSENRSIGLLLGLNTPGGRAGVHPMLRSDVLSRVGDRRLTLLPLTAERIRIFMEQLWPKLTRESGLQPFLLERAAAEMVEQRINELRPLASDDLSPSPVPRDVLNVLTLIGQAAVEHKVPPPIRAEQVRAWFGL